jgi:hypothetical protein
MPGSFAPLCRNFRGVVEAQYRDDTLCNIEVPLPRVLRSREVRRSGVVDEQAGV